MPRNPFKRSKPETRVVGLELDPSHLAAAEVSVNGHITVVHGAVAMLRPGVLRDGEVTDADALVTALRGLFAEHQMPTDVRLGLANQRIVVRTLDLPPLEDSKLLDAAVRLQAPDHIPMPIDEAVLDFESLGIVETPLGPRSRVVVVAARRDMVDSVVDVARRAGLHPIGIDLNAFAMIRSLDVGAGSNEGVLVVNVAGLTNVAVAAGSACLFTRTAAMGIETLAAEVAERGSLTLEHARQWLIHVGLEAPLEDISGEAEIVEVTRTVLADGVHHLADAVRNSLNFYRMQDSAQPVERAVLTGPAVAVPGFAAELSGKLRLPVTCELAALAPDAGEDASRLTVAAGLAVEERVG